MAKQNVQYVVRGVKDLLPLMAKFFAMTVIKNIGNYYSMQKVRVDNHSDFFIVL